MKVTLTMADAISTHPDGTFSLLRGGITQCAVPPGQPIGFKGALLARVSADKADEGKHRITIKAKDGNEKEIIPPVSHDFEVGTRLTNLNMLMDIQVQLPGYTVCEFSVYIDDKKMDAWSFDVKPLEVGVAKHA